jgi:hypothetical protein
LRRVHNLSQEEMNVLAQVASMGEVGSSRHFTIFSLRSVMRLDDRVFEPAHDVDLFRSALLRSG